MGERKFGGEIVAVHGGHIVRSTGRKDRHSKVCTAKGPRDRRVRLAARTAIQFYDVQDRLGYDRPSKAVDWLINKAKAAIDELDKLPAWDPITPGSATGIAQGEVLQGRIGVSDVSGELIFTVIGGGKSSRARNSSICVDSDACGGTSNSVFPTDSSIETNPSAKIHFQRFSNPDSKVALQLQNSPQQVLLSGIPLGFDGTANWPEHRQEAAELNRFQNLPSWNSGGTSASESESSVYLFNSPPAQQLCGNEQLFSQRGPLQSSFTPSIRAWIDPSMADHSHHQPPPPPPHEEFLPIYPPSLSGIGFGGFPGFQIPARTQGDEEEHHGYSDRPFSASSNYRSRKAEDPLFF